MEHIAILHKGPLKQILDGKKTIESRWTKNKIIPYKQINSGETIWLKYSGGLVVAKALVSKVKFYENLDLKKVKQILDEYGKEICADFESGKIYYEGKNYCTLVWLSNLEQVKPFQIDKTGFGNACAWLKK